MSERALIQRINRKLKPDDEMLRTSRRYWVQSQSVWYDNSTLGRYYVIDLRRNFVVHTHVDLEQYARELEALAPWETLAEEE